VAHDEQGLAGVGERDAGVAPFARSGPGEQRLQRLPVTRGQRGRPDGIVARRQQQADGVRGVQRAPREAGLGGLQRGQGLVGEDRHGGGDASTGLRRASGTQPG
jgi:hypothetical protein